MANMTVKDFARYVLSNLGRATVSNAMNITEKIDNEGFYPFDEFSQAIIDCVNEQLSTIKPNSEVASRVLVASYNARKKYSSVVKYNKKMIIDQYIIDMWEAVNK